MSKHINTRFVNLQKYVAVFNFEDICYSTYLHVIRDAEIFFKVKLVFENNKERNT